MRISEYDQVAELSNNALVPIVQGGITKRTTVNAIRGGDALTIVGSAARAIGDSQTAITDWFDKFCEEMGWEGTNAAVGGAMASDMWNQTAPVVVGSTGNPQYVVLPGFNDAHEYGADKVYRDYYRDELLAIIAWLAIPDSLKIRATNLSRWTYGGTWTTNANPIYGGLTNYNRYTATNASTATIVFTGGRTILL